MAPLKAAFERLSPRGKLGAISGVIVAMIGIAAVIAAASGGSDGRSASETSANASSGSRPVAESEGPDLQRCVNVWNKSFNAGSKSELVALVPSYVSVTTSNLYPGKCLVTGANPELNLAAQFLEGGSGPDAYSEIESGEANSLPASATNWNASADSEGNLTLKP